MRLLQNPLIAEIAGLVYPFQQYRPESCIDTTEWARQAKFMNLCVSEQPVRTCSLNLLMSISFHRPCYLPTCHHRAASSVSKNRRRHQHHQQAAKGLHCEPDSTISTDMNEETFKLNWSDTPSKLVRMWRQEHHCQPETNKLMIVVKHVVKYQRGQFMIEKYPSLAEQRWAIICWSNGVTGNAMATRSPASSEEKMIDWINISSLFKFFGLELTVSKPTFELE